MRWHYRPQHHVLSGESGEDQRGVQTAFIGLYAILFFLDLPNKKYMADGCIFCKIVKGELPSFKIYEDEKTLAFLDIHPVNPGHTLVIPKAEDTRNIFDIDASDWIATTETARKVAHAVEKGMGADGVNIMMNNRSNAGQVIDHPHIHVIPRFKGDGLTQWKHNSYKEGEADAALEKIRSAL